MGSHGGRCRGVEVLASWTALYRELRPLLHGGRVVGGDDDLTGALVHGVVAPDRSEALHAVVRLTSAAAAGFGGVRLPGFDLARRYRLRVRGDFLRPTRADAVPAWWAAASAGGVELSGTVLADVGLQLPVLGVSPRGFLLHSTP
ncbi:MAG: GH36 C-terminal domain-containing protein [Actinomycetota bacterium]|nr:GH36 C-terminal domain-containing protein [Actinomycetota bacterium]